jgi:hypothetical protein
VDPVTQPLETAFLRLQVDKRIENIRQNYQKVRVCTPAGIDIYNNSRGAKGYEPDPQVVQAQRIEPIEIPPEIIEEAERLSALEGN